MDSEDRRNVNMAIVISIGVLLISCIIATTSIMKLDKLVDNGYTQKTLLGADCPRWIKS